MSSAPVDVLIETGVRRIIAHRGASAAAPENTLAAFDLALAAGADAVELDVRVTADGVPVVIHDPTTGRTCDRDLAVASAPRAAVAELDAGHRFSTGDSFPYRGTGIRIPTLTEVLDRLRGVPILLDIKEPRGQEAVRAVLDRRRARDRVVVASTHAAALRSAREGGYRVGAARRQVARLWLAAAVGVRPRRVPFDLVSIPPRSGFLSLTGPRMLALAARLDLPVHVWTIDAPAEAARLWEGGVTGIITNRPGDLVALRGRGLR